MSSNIFFAMNSKQDIQTVKLMRDGVHLLRQEALENNVEQEHEVLVAALQAVATGLYLVQLLMEAAAKKETNED